MARALEVIKPENKALDAEAQQMRLLGYARWRSAEKPRVWG